MQNLGIPFKQTVKLGHPSDEWQNLGAPFWLMAISGQPPPHIFHPHGKDIWMVATFSEWTSPPLNKEGDLPVWWMPLTSPPTNIDGATLMPFFMLKIYLMTKIYYLCERSLKSSYISGGAKSGLSILFPHII